MKNMLWITHDLALVAGLVDRLAVMYAGSIVEQGPVREMFRSPQHPYTRGLLRALPHFEAGRAERLQAIPGSPPALRQVFSSCPFAPRCPKAVERCHLENPPSRVQAPGRSAEAALETPVQERQRDRAHERRGRQRCPRTRPRDPHCRGLR